MLKPHHIKRFLQLKWHTLRNNGLIRVHGIDVALPMSVAIPFMRQFRENTYEKEEAFLVKKYLPRERPVIELGSSIGIVSTLIRKHLAPSVQMLSVEGNSALMKIAQANVARYDIQNQTRFMHNAICYDAQEVCFSTGGNAHVNTVLRSGNADSPHEVVRARTLSDLVGVFDNKTAMSLVCDIEGAEWDMFEKDQAALGHFDTVIIETHPLQFQKLGNDQAGFDAMAKTAGFRLVERITDVAVFKRV